MSWSIFPGVFDLIPCKCDLSLEIGFLKVCSILNSILMIYPRMLLEGRCHLEPQSSCDVRSPSAPTLKLREAVMRRQRVFLPCCLATRALGKPCSALSVKSGMCQKKHPRLVLRNFFPLPLYPQDTSQFLQGLASLVAQRIKHLPTMQETQV